jgi:hypothetical protein
METSMIVLNVWFSAFALLTVVGLLVWAVLTSTRDQRAVANAHSQTIEPRIRGPRLRPSSPRQSGSRDSGPTAAVEKAEWNRVGPARDSAPPRAAGSSETSPEPGAAQA